MYQWFLQLVVPCCTPSNIFKALVSINKPRESPQQAVGKCGDVGKND